MHFCLTAQYTPQALNNIMDNPATNRYEAAKNLIEAAGGQLVSMYSTAADGPGVLVPAATHIPRSLLRRWRAARCSRWSPTP
jgi:hypothetical protein